MRNDTSDKRALALRVGDGGIGSLGDEILPESLEAVLEGVVQWRVPAVILCVDVRHPPQ